MSPGFAAFLGASRIGLAVSSYQSGKFYLLGQNVNGGLIVDERFFRKAMGICVADRDTILLATLLQVFRFRNVLDAGQQINNVFDACYVPREAFVTGELDTQAASSSSTRFTIASPRHPSGTASRRCGSRRSSPRSSRRTAAT
jgi:uncharacterized protein (TIGR03032 family)